MLTGLLLFLLIIPAGSMSLLAQSPASEASSSPAAPVAETPPPQPQESNPVPIAKVNPTLAKVNPPPTTITFSDPPQDSEFLRVHFFAEPLIPIGGHTTPAENRALAAALTSYAKGHSSVGSLTGFLSQYPSSPWKASLLVDLGVIYRNTGYWSKALAAWEEAWKLSKSATTRPATGIADRAVGEIAELNARLGRFDRLQALFAEIDKRPMHGMGAQKVAGAKQGMWMMLNHPDRSFRCGPMAVGSIFAAEHPGVPLNPKLFAANSTIKGTSLSQVCALANAVGLKFQMAKRSPDAAVIVPAVVNWKVGHYAAIVAGTNGRYIIQDPTFTDTISVTGNALDEEGSGYYVVPQGKLPPGWSPVAEDEGSKVWGKGQVYCITPPTPFGDSPSIPSNPNGGPLYDQPTSGGVTQTFCGMTQYSVDPSRINLQLSDVPVGYTPPVGPPVKFLATYSAQEVAPVSDPFYSNLGPQWSCNWVSYIVSDIYDQDTITYGPNGGILRDTGYQNSSYAGIPVSGGTSYVLVDSTGAFPMQPESHARLLRTSVTSYEMDFPDGSKQIYDLTNDPDYPGIFLDERTTFFMTKSVDPAGNILYYNYDGNFRLYSVTDAIGQTTTISYASDDYENPNFLLIASVTDPFGRSANFSYNGSGQLTSITDVLGIESSFTYSTGSDFVSSLATPYGTTDFTAGGSGVNLTLMATDPLGGTEFYEYDDDDPVDDISAPVPDTSIINTTESSISYEIYRNTYYWSKHAYAESPNVKSQALLMHWLHQTASDGDILNVGSDVLESQKPALESRIFYNYQDQPQPYATGSSNEPTAVGRVLDDGTTQASLYQYNNFGKVVSATDPAGRVTTYKYDPNGIDLLAVYQRNSSGSSTDVSGSAADLLASYSYNSQHCVVSATDSSGQATSFSYNTAGQLVTMTNALMQTTSNTYNSSGYLTRITGPETSATTSFTYDSYGRVHTVSDSQGYTITTSYDAADRVTQVSYPDGTSRTISYNKLDPEYLTDRLGRVTHLLHDALRHTVLVDDPLHHITQYEWCPCGALEAIVDPAGNQTSFIRDAESRVIEKVFSDGSLVGDTYENNTSRLKTVTDAMGQTTNYTYNLDNTISGVSYGNAQVSTPPVSFSYDPNYNRMTGFSDATTGTTTYSYNAITSGTSPGQGRLGSVTGPLANSTITYSYDQLGRLGGLAINGTANSSSSTFDNLGRVSAITNPLGTFNYGYLAETGMATSVSSTTGTTGQESNFSYYGNSGDERLEQIQNVNSTGGMVSQFNYGYDADGEITGWQQANSALSGTDSFGINYDAASQLSWAALTAGTTGTTSYSYNYDKAGNRTQEQIDSATTTSSYNSLNQLTGQSAGGITHFRGTLDKWATVTVAGNAATVTGASAPYLFDGTANLATGTNTVVIAATDASGRATATKGYYVVVAGGTGTSLSYDADGEMTSNGAGQTYQWDAANRLAIIWYGAIGSGSSTTFTYNALGQRVEIVEKDPSGTVTSTKQFVWSPGDAQPSEERDGSDNVTKRFYPEGEQISGTNYYFTRDHLGSVREMTDASGNVQSRYNYDLWGRQTMVSGTIAADFGYAGYYQHVPSGLDLTVHRAYNPDLARWISRDPIAESGGINLYAYCLGNPINRIDLLGLDCSILGAMLNWLEQNDSLNSPLNQEALSFGDWLANYDWGDEISEGLQALGPQFSYLTDWSAADTTLGEGGLTLFKFGDSTSTMAAGWSEGDYFLYLSNQGSYAANWAQNSSALRAAMAEGNPIFDSYIDAATGEQIPTTGFLNAERQLLENHGWTYVPQAGAYYPPIR
jgi:RHS repeat-associated protein